MISKIVTPHKQEKEILAAAARNSKKFCDDPILDSISKAFKEDFIEQVRKRYHMSPNGEAIRYDSFICAFYCFENNTFFCDSIVVGNETYRRPSPLLDKIESLEDMVAITYAIFEDASSTLKFLLSLFYSGDKSDLMAEAHIEDILYPFDGINPEHLVSKIVYNFKYNAENV